MKIKKYFISGIILVSAFALPSCQTPEVPFSPAPSIPGLSLLAVQPSHWVRFQVQLPESFRIQQQAQATFVKLTIKSPTQTIFASNADGNGFVATNGNNAVALGAQVPDGNNWAATAGFYANNNENALIQNVKSALHVPAAGNVEINMRTYLTGALIEQLQAINSLKLNNALDLNAYQSFVDTLTGMAINGNTFTFQTRPDTLDARDLALKISNGTIASVDAGSAGGLAVADFKQMPYIYGSYQAIGGTSGIAQVPAVNPSDGSIYFSDDATSDNLYGVEANLGGNGSLIEKFKLTNLEQFDNPHLTLGITNPTANSQVASIFALRQNGTTRELKAYQQSNGTQVWSFNFGGATASTTSFTPVTRLDTNGTGCGCDDQDVVYTAFNATNTAVKGIYAVRNGVQQWFYNHSGSDFTRSGALSPDKSTLYVATYEATNAKLMALATSNGALAWQLPLNHGIRQDVSPVVGTDGTVYAATFDGSGQGYLDAVNPNGTLKWSVQFPSIPNYAPVIDRQNGVDVIYVHTFDRKLYAIYEDQTLKWATPVTLPAGPVFSPLIGEEPAVENGQAGSRLLYIGTKTSSGADKLYAVRDKGSQGEIIWGYTPGGRFWGGLSLRNGKLYVTTLDGGDSQFIMLQAVKVPTPGLPVNAPWPKQGGDLKNSGKKP